MAGLTQNLHSVQWELAIVSGGVQTSMANLDDRLRRHVSELVRLDYLPSPLKQKESSLAQQRQTTSDIHEEPRETSGVMHKAP